MKNTTNDFMWSQFIKLGDMIGCGLHHEDPWISKEYRRLRKILVDNTPEMKKYNKELRINKNKQINGIIERLVKRDKCSKCGGELKQTRSGSKIVKCVDCETKFRYKIKI